jgi:hypothetical protein
MIEEIKEREHRAWLKQTASRRKVSSTVERLDQMSSDAKDLVWFGIKRERQPSRIQISREKSCRKIQNLFRKHRAKVQNEAGIVNRKSPSESVVVDKEYVIGDFPGIKTTGFESSFNSNQTRSNDSIPEFAQLASSNTVTLSTKGLEREFNPSEIERLICFRCRLSLHPSRGCARARCRNDS